MRKSRRAASVVEATTVGGPSAHYDTLAANTVEAAEYYGLSIVYGCVSLIAGKISSLPVIVEDENTGEYANRPRWVDRPDTSGIIPLTWPDVVSAAATSLLLDGNAYVAVVRDSRSRVQRIQVLHPGAVSLALRHNAYQILVLGEVPEFDVLMMRHIVNPGSVKGINPIHAARLTLETSYGVSRVSSSFFEQGAVTPGVVSIPTEVDESVIQGVADSWKKAHGGMDNAHLPIVMQDATYQSIGVSPEDAQFLETRRYTDAQIAGQIFHIEPGLMGVSMHSGKGSGALTYQNVGQQNRQLTESALMPIITRLEAGFSSLLPKGICMRFDLSEFLRADVLARFKTYEAAADIGEKLGEPLITAEEIRRREGWA